jgi:pimeloyl-ACP methyl ester carboxylesterase
MDGFSTPDLRSQLDTAVRSVPAAVLRSRLAEAMTVDVTHDLSQVQVPVLYLQARYDHLVPTTAADEIKRLQPHAQLADLLGPHFLLQCVPDACAAVIHAFLDDLERAF